MSVEPLPPGEDGIELFGPGAEAALQQAMSRLAPVPIRHLSLSDIKVAPMGSKLTITILFTIGTRQQEIAVSLSKSWAELLRKRIVQALR